MGRKRKARPASHILGWGYLLEGPLRYESLGALWITAPTVYTAQRTNSVVALVVAPRSPLRRF